MQESENPFERIVPGPNQAFIRGSGVSVARILGYLGQGKNVEEILSVLPELEEEDVYQALRFAARESAERISFLGEESPPL